MRCEVTGGRVSSRRAVRFASRTCGILGFLFLFGPSPKLRTKRKVKNVLRYGEVLAALKATPSKAFSHTAIKINLTPMAYEGERDNGSVLIYNIFS
jgi:hypothetical protein